MQTSEAKPAAIAPLISSEPQSRLRSLDALRGFDMFWILGADDLVQALHQASAANPFLRFLARQLDHSAWAGLTFYDLIFPLFVFIVGVSLVFSLERLAAKSGRAAAYKRVVFRTLVLLLLGIFYYWVGGKHFRLLGVLQRIALCYGFASLIFLNFKTRGIALWCAGLLILYWALMSFVPVPGVGAGNFHEGKNLANFIDRQYLPFFKWDGDHDPEGLLSTIPAIGTCLLGVLAGLLLRDSPWTAQKKAALLAAAGVAGILLGWLWNFQFPVIKKIWTSSYVLVAGGYSCLFLAAFYQVIEIWNWRKWAAPFIWIGMNPITLYMAKDIVGFHGVAERIAGGPLKAACGAYGELLIAAVALLIGFALARFLSQRKIFIRV